MLCQTREKSLQMSGRKLLPEEWSVHKATVLPLNKKILPAPIRVWAWEERGIKGRGGRPSTSFRWAVGFSRRCLHSSTLRWCRETSQRTGEHFSTRAEFVKKWGCIRRGTVHCEVLHFGVFVKAQRFLSTRRMQPAVRWWLHSVDGTSCRTWTWSEDASHNITAGRWEDTTHTHPQQTCKHCVTLWHSVKVTSRSLFRLAIISDLSLQPH